MKALWRRKRHWRVWIKYKLSAMPPPLVTYLVHPTERKAWKINEESCGCARLDVEYLQMKPKMSWKERSHLTHRKTRLPLVDLRLGLQLQRTAGVGKQRKPADPVQDRCSARRQHHPGKSPERERERLLARSAVCSPLLTFSLMTLVPPCAGRLRVCAYVGSYGWGVCLRLGSQLLRPVGNGQ